MFWAETQRPAKWAKRHCEVVQDWSTKHVTWLITYASQRWELDDFSKNMRYRKLRELCCFLTRAWIPSDWNVFSFVSFLLFLHVNEATTQCVVCITFRPTLRCSKSCTYRNDLWHAARKQNNSRLYWKSTNSGVRVRRSPEEVKASCSIVHFVL